MRFTLRTLLVVSLLVVPIAARAQSVDPSGHWEGAITDSRWRDSLSGGSVEERQGKLVATSARPGDDLRGLPMAT